MNPYMQQFLREMQRTRIHRAKNIISEVVVGPPLYEKLKEKKKLDDNSVRKD